MRPSLNRRFNLYFILILLCFVCEISEDLLGQDIGILRPGTVTFEEPFKHLNLYSPDFQSVSTSEMDDFFSNILLEDSKGFIWMAWQGSIVRYDGYQLINFNQIPAGSNGLDTHLVQAMAEDEHGNLWMGCRGGQGLYRYNPKMEIFEKFPRHENDPRQISDEPIWSISADMNGSVWIGTTDDGNGLYRYDVKSDTFEVFWDEDKDPLALPGNNVSYVYADGKSNVWLNCNWSHRYRRTGGFYHYNRIDRKFRKVLFSEPDIDQYEAYADCIGEDSQGNLWMNVDFAKDGEYVSRKLILIPVPCEDYFKQVTDTSITLEGYKTYPGKWYYGEFDIDPEDHLWMVGQELGVIKLEPSRGLFNQYMPENFTEAPYNWFYNILSTRSGSVWYGFNIGINQYMQWKRKFTLYNPAFFEQITGKPEEVHSVYEAEDGIIWIGLKNRLLKYNPMTLESRIYTFLDMRNAMTSTLMERNNPLKVIEPGEDGELLVSGDNFLFEFNINEERFDLIGFPEEQWYKFGYLVESNHLFRDRNGLCWIGVGPGCIQADLQEGKARYLYGLRHEQFLGGATIYVGEDQLGKIWMGTWQGLNRFEPSTGKVDNIIYNHRITGGLASSNVSSMTMDGAGNLWTGHKNKGISYLDSAQVNDPNLHPDSLKFTYLTMEDGLPDLHIHDLVSDLSGNIWIASRTGLSCFEPGTREIKVYTETDGVDILPFTSKFFVNKRTGKIYIGGARGLLSFHPDSIPVNSYVPPVVITEFKLHDKTVSVSDTSVLHESIIYTKSLDLTYDQNFLEFTFAALDYTDPLKNQYKYFMEDVDPDTVYAGTDRTAVYRDMKPGNYTFWVTGSNNDGVWNPDGTTLEIRIRPPWYRSSLASGTYALLALLILAGIIWWRTARLQKEKLMLEAEVAFRTRELRQKNEQILEMEQLKTRFFTDVSHEIRTPLTLIGGPLDNLIRKDYRDADTLRWLRVIKRNSNRLLHLVNQLLDISRLDAGQMKLVLRRGDVIKHLRILVQEYHSLAESRHIKFISELPEGEWMTLYDREKTEKVVTNLLSNAFKFTPDFGIVTFRVKTRMSLSDHSRPFVRILVADTGPGIPEGERDRIFERFYRSREADHETSGGTGIGLSLTRELTNMMKGDIYVRSAVGDGTVFIVTVPMGKAHLSPSEYVVKEDETELDSQVGTGGMEDRKPPEDTEQSPDKDILIVEDNADLRTYIRENLPGEYKIIEAKDGREGLEKARSLIPDMVISDIMMPGMDGMELCGKLKSDERTSHVPVILLTAKSTLSDKIEGLGEGADDYISKPFDLAELKARIRNLLEQREKLKQKYSGMVGLDWDTMSVTTLDEKFLKKITTIISERMDDSEFNVGVLQDEMAMSRVNLFRKLKALTGDTPSGLIKTLRLKTAAKMLEKGEESITHIALNTGFSNSSLFAQVFKKEYGMTPGEYRKLNRRK
jgi:signal transduction histidine kinase/DNA-binding response OmpR family regulator/streptogramin lyase